MKRNYILPQCLVFNVQTASLIAGTITESTKETQTMDGVELGARCSRDWADDEE